MIHHTDCGMETFTFEVMDELLAGSLKTATVDATGWLDSNVGGGTSDGKGLNWLTISDNGRNVVEDVQRICGNSMVPADIPIYDCESGKLIEVPEAMAAGRAV